MLATPGSPPLLPHSGLSLSIPLSSFPDLPLEIAVEEYSSWQKQLVHSKTPKDDIGKACDVALTNGLDLKQIDKDQDPEFFIKNGVKVGVARVL
jgi:hypothetical protein